MTVKMSSEGDSAKNAVPEANDKPAVDQTDSSQDSQDLKDVKNDKQTDNNIDAKPDDEKSKSESADDSQDSVKKEENNVKEDNEKPKNDVNDKEKKDETASKPSKEEDKNDVSAKEEDEDENDVEEEETEVKKKPSKKSKEDDKDSKNENDFEEGSGTALCDIPRIDASISRFKIEDLKLLHRLLYNSPGKNTLIKKNIRRFNGFTFKKGSTDYDEKVAIAEEMEVKNLKSICEMLDLQKSGTKEEITERLLDFLMEPKDIAPKPTGGRPKRTAAVRANNRGYSSHDDYSSDDKHTPRGRRDKGRRPNLKDESSSESDEDFHPSDESEEKPRVAKRRGPGRRKAASDDESSEASGASSDDSDYRDEPKTKKKKTAKVINNRGRGTGRRGRPPGSTKKNLAKSRKTKDSTDEDDDDKHDGSSSEDEPLAKKAKGKEPPTDEELKDYIKSILEGANLEEITMKTVCQKVYAHYPDFDLAHKKDFIKMTVKSLIST